MAQQHFFLVLAVLLELFQLLHVLVSALPDAFVRLLLGFDLLIFCNIVGLEFLPELLVYILAVLLSECNLQ